MTRDSGNDPLKEKLEAISDINKANNRVTFYRPLNESAERRIGEGATGKKFNIHGKSATTWPIDGFVPFVSGLSKLSQGGQDRISHFQEENQKSVTEGLEKKKEMQNQLDNLQNQLLRMSNINELNNFPEVFEYAEKQWADLITTAPTEAQKYSKEDFIAENAIKNMDILKQKVRNQITDLMHKINDEGIVDLTIAQINGNNIHYITDMDGNIIYDQTNKPMFVVEQDGKYFLCDHESQNYDREFKMPKEVFQFKPVEVMSYVRYEITNEKYLDYERQTVPVTADLDGFTTGVGISFNDRVDGLTEKFVKEFNLGEEYQGITNMYQFLDEIKYQNNPELKLQFQNFLTEELTKIELAERKSLKEELSVMRSGAGKISDLNYAVNVAERGDTQGVSKAHGDEVNNPNPEKIPENEVHLTVDQDGNVKELMGQSNIVEEILQKRDEGYRIPMRPEWAQYNQTENAITTKTIDWHGLREEVKNSPNREAEEQVLNKLDELERLKLEQDPCYTDIAAGPQNPIDQEFPDFFEFKQEVSKQVAENAAKIRENEIETLDKELEEAYLDFSIKNQFKESVVEKAESEFTTKYDNSSKIPTNESEIEKAASALRESEVSISETTEKKTSTNIENSDMEKTTAKTR